MEEENNSELWLQAWMAAFADVERSLSGGPDLGTVLTRNLSRRDCPLGSSLASVDLTSSDASATGGRRRFALV